MKSQLFKTLYPKEEFLLFLKKYCIHNEKCITFSKESFKKIKLDKKEQIFFDLLKPYYLPSKKKYVDREPIYKHFVTVIKQISKSNSIPHTSNINYCKSTYNLSYLFYYKM
jgi:hypothetical protein